MDIDLSAYPILGGILIGLVLALPTGPGAFMVMKQGIGQPMLTVFKLALICMLVDFFWNVALCAFGDTSLMVVSVLTEHKEIIKASAGPILICIGLYALRSMFLASDPVTGVWRTLAVALFNPLVPVTLTALLTYVVGGAYFTSSASHQFQVIAGVFIGEAIMWMAGIRLFHALMLRGLPEKAIPIIFIILFTFTGAYLTVLGFLN